MTEHLHKINKYKDFFGLLKEDLNKMMLFNRNLSGETKEVIEEKNYYQKVLEGTLVGW